MIFAFITLWRETPCYRSTPMQGLFYTALRTFDTVTAVTVVSESKQKVKQVHADVKEVFVSMLF